MSTLNTKQNRAAILDRVEKDGITLSEFSKEQKTKIIKMYAAICLNEGLI